MITDPDPVNAALFQCRQIRALLETAQMKDHDRRGPLLVEAAQSSADLLEVVSVLAGRPRAEDERPEWLRRMIRTGAKVQARIADGQFEGVLWIVTLPETGGRSTFEAKDEGASERLYGTLGATFVSAARKSSGIEL